MRIASVGHALFAATMVALGILSIVEGRFAPIWSGVPKDVPGRQALVYLCACVSVICGASLFLQRAAGAAARVLFAYLLIWMVLFKVPNIARAPAVEVYYQNWGETAVLMAGAWVLYARFAATWDRRQLGFATGDRGVRLARELYALALIAFGLSHFAYLDLTAPLVPSWLPAHVAWAYFTGCAYLAAAAAVLTGVCARLAAALAALQMGLFTLLVWLPLMTAGTMTAGQLGEFIVSWALTTAAWVIADSYRDTPWLAVRSALGAGPGSASGRAP
ncbi:MAG TPA: hypothetical protein VFX20_22475 [Steroidobacteraceae bacterium]|nr:hypothetical protein [Steroidobacteraceae bacterium]